MSTLHSDETRKPGSYAVKLLNLMTWKLLNIMTWKPLNLAQWLYLYHLWKADVVSGFFCSTFGCNQLD